MHCKGGFFYWSFYKRNVLFDEEPRELSISEYEDLKEPALKSARILCHRIRQSLIQIKVWVQSAGSRLCGYPRFDITMAVFGMGLYWVDNAAGVISPDAAIDVESPLAAMTAIMETMEVQKLPDRHR